MPRACVQVAACNFDTPHLRLLVKAGVPLVANQVQYSLLDRRPETAMRARTSTCRATRGA